MARRQLLAAGLTPRIIQGALRSGRLRIVFNGIYAVGHVALESKGWWMAALLAAGEGAALSHRSAAMLWRLRSGPVLPVHVASGSDRGRKQRNLKVHRTTLHPSEVMVFDGLRVTTPARAIVDMAATLENRELRRMIERAQDLRRFHPDEIHATLQRRPRRPGCRELTRLLALLQPDSDNARSHLERMFLALVRRARLPGPQVNAPIAGRKRDFVWPDARLVVEVDSYAYHSSRRAMREDRRRDRELTALGWRPARFTYEDVAFEPEQVAAGLAGLLGR